jgi:CheY-like chemotaxis protein
MQGQRAVSDLKQVDLKDQAERSPASPCVLIAEDNPDSRDALRALLEAYGYEVLEAENGGEAIDKARELRPDLILMDIMMPYKDGLEATRTLRADPEFRQVPILALTAMAGSRELALKAGCDDYLQKPIDIPGLLKRIGEWLARGHSNDGA